ncbi:MULTISPECIES: SDR family oxidoreductase [Pseudomonas]|uniref:Citronellol dehydrogenase 2 n=1 Tax=Pseudomonas chlororaphis subsp. aureofaciens TaxID=587851 RepID=A0AAD0ZNU7_9PSED|nr:MULTISPECIES: NAD(P)-dependent oxidoreductase [Pseudomonas]AZE19963.1 Citronellol dehydrogenase 2 [Pseudomonas chlororaphis subsp. aureofaciens]AZE32574.1 Citronellol dehydrogenase 2 [Pseudomonas chlororaphis subsp. aureofaciens]AZE38854.1 Citronellol dehydrogenase 2 [Pseudomonas chlororaphis subsp. aureofaciens]AZE45216.1 Citronellol dehydrogenase 2 [Pseudomonas chlororaphis subsp. aureofaciens]QHC92330.1 short chain dehydrogenase [Pseudomonas chlororaphis]
MSLQGKTLFITGASRGIGREIALRAARDGANIVIAAKSADPHPKLPGTIFSVAREVEALGGKALALQVDVRDEEVVRQALAKAAEQFGGIDALVNNAGAIKLTGVQHIELKRFDLMHQINTRAVLLCSQAALPYLKSSGGHILNLSPPLNLASKWFAQYSPYTVTKYGMSMLTLGMSEEFKNYGISVNSLWPQTMIATAAIEFQLGSRESFKHARTPAIMADAAYAILSSSQRRITGRLLIDEEILREQGVSDFAHYRFDPDSSEALMTDLFID